MNTVKEIKSAIAKLTLKRKRAIRDWLDDLIEDQLEVSNEFKAKIQRAKQETITEEERRRAIDEILDEVLRGRPTRISLSEILDRSRR